MSRFKNTLVNFLRLPIEVPLALTDQLNQDLPEVESAESVWNRITVNRVEVSARREWRA
ncbi:MAG: hypothetical protein NTNFB01_35860 [Nitrospira sp.]